MKRAAALVALAACLLPYQAAVATRAREVPVSIAWSLNPSAITGSGTLDLRGSKILQIGITSPLNVFRLDEDAVLEGGKVFIPKGVQLAWANGAHQIACEPIRVEKHVYFRCLLDSDGDGTLDFALVASAMEIASWRSMEHFEYLMGPFVAIEPIGLTSMAKPLPIGTIKEEPSELKAGVYLAGRAGSKGVTIALCVSRPGYESVCAPERTLPLNGSTAETDQFGLRMVATVIPNGPATITVTPNGNDLAL